MTRFAGYLAERKFLGATVGRYANRIARGRFSLDGESVQLPVNNGPNALHGGLDGFDRKLWRIAAIDDGAEPAVTLTYTSAARRGRTIPASWRCELTYRVIRTGGAVARSWRRGPDRPTVVNLTNHSFFNLEGATSGPTILDHRLTVAAEQFLAIDPTAIPLPRAAERGGRHAVRLSRRPLRGRRAHPQERPSAAAQGPRLRSHLLSRARRQAGLASRHGSRSRVRDACWSCSPTSPACRSIPATFSTASTAGKGRQALSGNPDAMCLEPHIWPDRAQPARLPDPAPFDPGEVYRHHHGLSLCGEDAMKMEEVPTTVLCAERCHLGEGPTYDAATDTAWWFDIVERRLFEARLDTGSIRHPFARRDGQRARADRRASSARRRRGRPLYPRARRWADDAVPSARSRQCRDAFERLPGFIQSGTFWIGTMGRKAERRAGRHLCAASRRAVDAVSRHHDSERDLLLAGWRRSAISPTPRTNVLFRRRARCGDRPAARRAGRADRHAGRRRHRRRGGRCRRADLECALGRRAASMSTARKASSCARSACRRRQSSCPAFVGPDFSRLLVTSAWQDMDDDATPPIRQAGRTFAARGRRRAAAAEPDVKLA